MQPVYNKADTGLLVTDLHFESRSLALFVCFDIALCTSFTHVPDSERMVGGRTKFYRIVFPQKLL